VALDRLKALLGLNSAENRLASSWWVVLCIANPPSPLSQEVGPPLTDICFLIVLSASPEVMLDVAAALIQAIATQ